MFLFSSGEMARQTVMVHILVFGRCLMDFDEFSMHDRHGIWFDFIFSVFTVRCMALCFVCWFDPYVFRCTEPHTRETIFVWSMVVGTLRVSSEGWRVLLQILLVDRATRWFWDAWELNIEDWQKAYCLLLSRIQHFHINDFPFSSSSALGSIQCGWVIDTFEWIFVLWYCVLHTILPIIAFYYILKIVIYVWLYSVLLHFHTGDQFSCFFSHYYDYLLSFRCLILVICELNAIGLQPQKDTHFQTIYYHFIAKRRNWEIRWLLYPSIYYQFELFSNECTSWALYSPYQSYFPSRSQNDFLHPWLGELPIKRRSENHFLGKYGSVLIYRDPRSANSEKKNAKRDQLIVFSAVWRQFSQRISCVMNGKHKRAQTNQNLYLTQTHGNETVDRACFDCALCCCLTSRSDYE